MNGNTEPIEFSAGDVKEMVIVVDEFFENLRTIYNKYGSEPADGSPARKELDASAHPEQISTGYSIGAISIEAAGDHLIAFADLLKEPVKTLAPLTCIRSLLESCAIACWLLDPSIDQSKRLARTFALRYNGFVEQRKLLAINGDPAKLAWVDERIVKVETDSLECGFQPVLDRRGNRCGIAQVMPTIIDQIRSTLDKEFEYRLLSGVAHSHYWAIQQVGFEIVANSIRAGKGLTKTLVPNMAIFFGMTGVVCFAKALWFLWQLYGWQLEDLKSLLEASFDKLNYSHAVRFWK